MAHWTDVTLIPLVPCEKEGLVQLDLAKLTAHRRNFIDHIVGTVGRCKRGNPQGL